VNGVETMNSRTADNQENGSIPIGLISAVYDEERKNNLQLAMDKRMLLVRKRGLILLEAIIGDDENAFQHQLRLYKDALKNHLKLVGVDLYVHLKNREGASQQGRVVRDFEAKTMTQLTKVSALLNQGEVSRQQNKKLFAKAVGAANLSLVRRYEEEKAVLLPLI